MISCDFSDEKETIVNAERKTNLKKKINFNKKNIVAKKVIYFFNFGFLDTIA